jgi:NTE family protein
MVHGFQTSRGHRADPKGLAMTNRDRTLQADLVLEGGGVKGIGLVGAAVALTEAGYRFNRVAGTSAGAIVGSMIAAGLTGEDLRNVALSLDYRKFIDAGALERIPVLGPGLALLEGSGLYKGDYARDWVRGRLADLGIHTFGDLRIDDDDLPAERRYKLVVTASDVTLGRLVRLPWDYRSVYGRDPDEQPVADAVRASMSIPFFFRTVPLINPVTASRSTLVDGGLLSNFPIDSFDRTDGRQPKWPTFGVTLLPNLPAGDDKVIPLLRLPHPGGLHLLENVISTILVGRDQTYLDQPWVSARTIRVDSTAVGVLDFGISAAATQALYEKGFQAAQAFLQGWDWPHYLRRFRPQIDAPG